VVKSVKKCNKKYTKWEIMFYLSHVLEKTVMLNLIGVFDCKVDEKGRIMFPSALKKRLQSIISDGFIIKKSLFADCLEVYPMSEWNRLISKIEQKNQFTKKIDVYKRHFMSSHREVNLDGASRFLIPKDLIEQTGLGKDIVLASAVNKIEIWDKTKYEEELSKPIDFESLSDEVMGESPMGN
jgi:MraZ protein